MLLLKNFFFAALNSYRGRWLLSILFSRVIAYKTFICQLPFEWACFFLLVLFFFFGPGSHEQVCHRGYSND